MVVDDEPDIAELYTSWLADEYEVLTAISGHEALERLRPDVDVVLLDRRMPGLPGDEVLSAIRAQEIDCRVALVTAVEPNEDLIGMGFDDYLTKPVSAQTVRTLVRQLVSLHREDDLLQEYFALAAKIGTLRSSRAADELEANPEFQQLLKRFSRVKQAAREELVELMMQDEGDKLFRQLIEGWDGTEIEGEIVGS